MFLLSLRRFHMDPSGTFIEFEAKAIGSGSEGAQSHLQEVYHKVSLAICIEYFILESREDERI